MARKTSRKTHKKTDPRNFTGSVLPLRLSLKSWEVPPKKKKAKRPKKLTKMQKHLQGIVYGTLTRDGQLVGS